MTQILSCLTADYIIQASDMRLSDVQSDWVKEKSMKMVCYKNSAVISFTGAAVLGTTRTDEWIVDVLQNSPDLDQTLANLKERAGRYVRANPLTNRRLAFVVATFAHQGHAFAIPTLHVVSNFHDHQCRPLATPTSEFNILTHSMDMSRSIEFHWAGAHLSKNVQDLLWGNIKQSIEKSPHPNGKPQLSSIASNLVNAIRRTSHEEASGGTVGEDVVVSILPNRSIPALRDTPVELQYYGRNSADPESLVPHMVTGNGGVIWDVKIQQGISD